MAECLPFTQRASTMCLPMNFSDARLISYRFFLRHSHGGVGLRVFHRPMLVSRAFPAARYQERQG